MRVRTFAAVAAALAIVSTVATAQDQGPPGGGGRSPGMRMGGTRGATFQPLAPDSLSAIVSLDDAQRRRYTAVYDGFLQRTGPQRDSLRAIVGQAQAARQSGDQAAAQQHMKATRGLRSGLREQHKVVDDSLKQILTADQWAKYGQWRADRRKKMEQGGRGRRRRD